MKNREWSNYIFLALLGAALFLPYLGNVHLFDWDEINFAETAREMIVTGDYFSVMIDYEAFHEKPPLFMWMQAASMHAFGINEFAARFPNAIIGIITMLVLYRTGRMIFDYRFGFLWVIAFIGSLLPHFYFKSGIIDPTFNLFMFLGVYFIAVYHIGKHKRSILLAGIFTALAVLTKGPVGYLLVFMTWIVFWVVSAKSVRFPWREMLLFTLIASFPAFIWYGIIFVKADSGLISEFIMYQIRLLTTQDAGHGGPFYYHFVVVLFGCFPASIFLFRSFKKSGDDDPKQKLMKRIMIIMMLVVLIIFSIVKTKILHYSSLSYFPVTFLAAYGIYGLIYREEKLNPVFTVIIGIIGIALALGLTLFPLALMNVEMILPKVTDEFTNALLRANVNWAGFEFAIGIIYLIGIIASMVYLFKKKYLQGVLIAFASTAFVVLTFLPLVAPKIEQYTQGAPIEFYEDYAGKDVYVRALGFKSYAQYFYTRKTPDLSLYQYDMDYEEQKNWLLNGAIDRPAVFVTKVKGNDKYIEHENLIELYRKNGFVFLKRKLPIK